MADDEITLFSQTLVDHLLNTVVPLSSVAPQERLLPLNNCFSVHVCLLHCEGPLKNDDPSNTLYDGNTLADGRHLPPQKRPLGVITIKKRLKN